MIESVQRRVSIQSVEPEVMQQLVDYVYTSEICITQVFFFAFVLIFVDAIFVRAQCIFSS